MTDYPFKEFSLRDEPLRGLCVDPGVDWVARVVHERMLADRDTRTLREHAWTRAQLRALNNTRLQTQARTRCIHVLSKMND